MGWDGAGLAIGQAGRRSLQKEDAELRALKGAGCGGDRFGSGSGPGSQDSFCC